MQLGMVHFNQMPARSAIRPKTREAIKEFQVFVERYPNSKLITQVEAAIARSQRSVIRRRPAGGQLLFEHSPVCGGEPRYRHILETDPEFSRRDSVYFPLGGNP